MTNKELNQKFVDGDPLTDDELGRILLIYKYLSESLEFLDPPFKLFKGEIYRRYEILKGFKEARRKG